CATTSCQEYLKYSAVQDEVCHGIRGLWAVTKQALRAPNVHTALAFTAKRRRQLECCRTPENFLIRGIGTRNFISHPTSCQHFNIDGVTSYCTMISIPLILLLNFVHNLSNDLSNTYKNLISSLSKRHSNKFVSEEYRSAREKTANFHASIRNFTEYEKMYKDVQSIHSEFIFNPEINYTKFWPKESPNVSSVPVPSASENRGSRVGHERPDTPCCPESSRRPVLLTCSEKLVPCINPRSRALFVSCLEESAAMWPRSFGDTVQLRVLRKPINFPERVCTQTFLPRHAMSDSKWLYLYEHAAYLLAVYGIVKMINCVSEHRWKKMLTNQLAHITTSYHQKARNPNPDPIQRSSFRNHNISENNCTNQRSTPLNRIIPYKAIKRRITIHLDKNFLTERNVNWQQPKRTQKISLLQQQQQQQQQTNTAFVTMTTNTLLSIIEVQVLDCITFYLDDLSDCSDNYSVNDSGDKSDASDVIIPKRCGALQLEYSNLEDDDPNDVEINDDTRLTNDEPRILEPFEGSPGIKIMPSSPENIIDCANLFTGDITASEMKKFLELIVLMGQVKKNALYKKKFNEVYKPLNHLNNCLDEYISPVLLSQSKVKMENNIFHGLPIKEIPNITLGKYVFDCLRSNGEHIVQIDANTNRHYTCKDILKKSIIVSNALRSYEINIEDRISIAAENHPNYMIVMCSSLFIGATFTPLNPAYTEREFKRMLELYQPRLLFISQRTEKILTKIASNLSWSIKLIELDDKSLDENIITLNEIVEKYKNIMDPNTFLPTQIDDNSKRMAVIFCSSGTTGFPKGVMLSHKNLLVFMEAAKYPGCMNIEHGDRIVIFLPLFHGYAFGMMNITISCGATVCIMRNFDLETLLKSVEQYRITNIPLVPPVLVTLAKHPIVLNYDFNSVREILCGAAPLPKDIHIYLHSWSQEIADEVKRRTKVKIIRNGYGMTELTVVSNISDKMSNDNSVGPVMPGLKYKVVNTETGKTLSTREVGEVCFAGDRVMLGYFKNSKITAETIDKENWLHTGDLGYFNEEGTLYITGRIKEIIKYKAFQVSPSEIEEIIMSHPNVKDAAVLGKPDKLSGEIPMALVVKQPGKIISVKEILDFTNGHLSPYKWLRGGLAWFPDNFIFRDTFYRQNFAIMELCRSCFLIPK
ncbi:Luciferin 4-monooxygenase, partial [Melipona quadrifasciata]